MQVSDSDTQENGAGATAAVHTQQGGREGRKEGNRQQSTQRTARGNTEGQKTETAEETEAAAGGTRGQ